ncbi:thioesterase family protein [Nocardia sp. ET3-3]|uniref:Thioesterase family protein n=1 Tax=Nocardia terrae TaxID=2675851 RepID=A0A7K1URF3_9NOCA|nr:thioesterase family protein [Nocardia terrae]MVU76924.1 thioesterase family protein [Nocardia terrae]
MGSTTALEHPFDLATDLTPAGEGRFLGRTSPGYSNMVGPFGGITAATMLRAVLDDPRCSGSPLSITVNYAGPVADGEFTIDADPVRTNNTTQHWVVTMSQHDAVVTTATVVCALRRDTWSDTEITPPAVPAPEAVEAAVTPEFPAWLGNYEMRFVEGGVPFEADSDGSPTSTTTLWVRDTPARTLDHLSLTAMCDIFFPRVMLRLGRMVPAGTVSFTVYFHTDAGQFPSDPTPYVLATARGQHFGNGFFDQSAQLWTADGTPLATSHQVVYFKG